MPDKSKVLAGAAEFLKTMVPGSVLVGVPGTTLDELV